MGTTPTTDKLKYFDVKPIQPEQVRTVEFGYRGMFKKLYVDAGYYHSWYTNFIGFNIGVQSKFQTGIGGGFQSVKPSAFTVWPRMLRELLQHKVYRWVAIII